MTFIPEQDIDSAAGGAVFDDFISQRAIGELLWTQMFSGIGSGVSANSSQVNGNTIGVRQLATGISSSGRGGLRQFQNGMTNLGASGGSMDCEWRIKVDTLGGGGQDYVLAMGWSDNTGGGFGNSAIGMRYNSTLSPNLFAFARVGGVDTQSIDTGVVMTTDWMRVAINVTPVGAQFLQAPSPGGTLAPVASIATVDLPGPSDRFGAQILMRKLAGTTSRLAYLDFFKMNYTFGTSR